MTTCSLNYIDNSKTISGALAKDFLFEGKPLSEFLTNKHIEVAKQFQSFTDFKIPSISKKSTVSDKLIKYYRLPNLKDYDGKNRREKLLKHIQDINDIYGDVITVRPKEFYNNNYEIVYIDIRDMSPESFEASTEEDFDESGTEEFFRDLYNSYILSDQSQTFEKYVENNSEKFLSTLLNVKERINVFLQNPSEIESEKTKEFKRKLRSLSYEISKPEVVNKMTAIDNFIKEAVNFSSDSFNRLRKGNDRFSSYKQRYDEIITQKGKHTFEDGLKIQSKQKNEELSDLMREIEKIKNKLYIFNYLKEFQKEMIDAGIVDDIFEIYNSFKVDSVLSVLLNENNVEQSAKSEFIQKVFSKKYRDTDDFKKTLKLDLISLGITVTDEFIDTMRTKGKDKTMSETIKEAVTNLNSVINDTKELSLSIVASTLYPYYLTGWNKNSDKKELSYQMSYDKFKDSLLLSEENPSLANLWLASGEGQDDSILFSTARALFDNLRTEDFRSYKDGQTAFETLKLILNSEDPVKLEKRTALEKSMTSYIHELPEDEVISYYRENSNGFLDANDNQFEIVSSELDENNKAVHINLKSDDQNIWITKLNSFEGKWVKTNRVKALIHEFSYRNEIEFRAFSSQLDKEVQKLLDIIKEKDIDKLKSELVNNYHIPLLVKVQEILDEEASLSDINDREFLKRILKRGFYQANEKPANNEKTVEAFLELKKVAQVDIEDSTKSIFEVPFTKSRNTTKWFYNNSYDVTLQDKTRKGEPYSNLEYLLDETVEQTSNGEPYRALAVKNKGKDKILVEKESGELEFVLYEKVNGRYVFKDNAGNDVALYDIKRYYMKAKNLKTTKIPKLKSELEHTSRLKTDKEYNDLYLFYKEKHKSFNKRLGVSELKNFKIPQISKSQTFSLKQKLFNNLSKPLKTLDNLFDTEKKIYSIDEDGNYLDKNGNITTKENADYYHYNKEDLDGFDSQKFVPKFTTNLKDQELVEDDLFISFMTFNDSVGKYNALYDIEPQMRILKLISQGSKGDFTLFTGREKLKGKDRASLISKPQTKLATTASNNLVQMINHYVYGDEKVKEDWLGKNNAHKIANMIKGLNAYQVLAFNWVASFTNLEVGMFNNFSAAIGGKFGITAENLRKGYGQYAKYMADDFVDTAQSGFKTKSLYEKNHLTQLAVVFDAIKGNEVKVSDRFETKNILQKYISKEGLFLTSAIPEHMNQLPLMVAYMMSYKINDNFTLWDSYKKGSEGQTTIRFFDEKGEDYANYPEIFEPMINDFMKKLTVINSEAHGNYGKYDTAMMSRYALGGLALQFGRWIYPSFKARFVSGNYDKQLEDYVDRGYVRWYMKSLVSDTFTEYSFDWDEDKKFIENMREQILDKSKQAALSASEILLINGVGKQLTYFFDRLSFGKLGENEKINSWLYGDLENEDFITKFKKSEKLIQLENETEDEFNKRVEETFQKRKESIIRATWEMTVIVGAILIGMGLAAINDDDDDDKNMALSLLEVFCKRFISDVGIFSPTISPFGSWDFILRKLKDPFSITAQLERNVSFLTQLLGFNFTEGDINFKINDVYENSGNGYEKGDLKIKKKFQKTILAPYFQVTRLFNPQELENTVNLLNKNSLTSGPKDKDEQKE